MARGKRKFVVEITETQGLTEGELTKVLMRLAGSLASGRASIEGGKLRDSRNYVIGSYSWKDQPTWPPPAQAGKPG
jgi:hypothetical protein